MIDPVGPTLVHNGDELLVFFGAAKLRHDRLQGVLIANKSETSGGCHPMRHQGLALIVEKTVRVTIPEEPIDLEVMINPFNSQ